MTTAALYQKGERIRIRKPGAREIIAEVSAHQLAMHPYVFYRDKNGAEHCARAEHVERIA